MYWPLLTLIIFTVCAFIVFTILRRWADSFILIAFAIGFIVNANFYTAISTPIYIQNSSFCPIVFSYDAVLYAVFIFIVVVKFTHYPTKDGKLLAYSSVVAIVISAVIETCARLAYNINDWKESLIVFSQYILSGGVSLFVVFLVVKVIKKMLLKKRHPNFIISAVVFGGTMLHQMILYCFVAIFVAVGVYHPTSSDGSAFNLIPNLGWIFLGSLILTIFVIILSMISLPIQLRVVSLSGQ